MTSCTVSTTLSRLASTTIYAAILAISPVSISFSRAGEVPPELKEVGITEHLGESVSLKDLHFTDESGSQVSLGQFVRPGHPVILTLVYYECPNLCNFLLNGLLTSLKGLDWTVGNQFDILTVSINPRETPALASQKKQAYLASYGNRAATAMKGWHFLTGSDDQIHKLAGQVGFGYKYDTGEKQYAHAAAVFVLTPEGRISRYLYGIDFKERDLKLALTEASDGRIGNVIDRLLLFCYHYDPHTRKYSMVITKVMQAGSAGSTVLVGGYLVYFWNGQRRRRQLDSEASKKDQTKGA